MKKLLTITTLFLMFSCAQLKTPPNRSLTELKSASDLNSFEQDTLALKELSDKNEINCDQMLSASSNKSIPISKWAMANYLLQCDITQDFLNKEIAAEDEYPAWAKKNLYKAIIKKSKSNKNIIFAKLRITKYLKTQSEKVFNLKQAVKIGKQNKLDISELETLLEVIAPRYSHKVNIDNAYSIARDYERSRNFKQARKLYNKLIYTYENKLEDKVKAWNRIRQSYKLEHDKERYFKETKKLVKFIQKHLKKDSSAINLYTKYSVIVARIQWTRDELSKALKTLKQLLTVKEISSEARVPIYYHLGAIEDDLNHGVLANSLYEKAYNSISDDHELKEKILWNIAWFQYRNKNYTDAIKWLSTYQIDTSKSVDYKFLYWKAKALEKIGKSSEADDIFEDIMENDSFGYYGQISHIGRKELTSLSINTKNQTLKADALSWAIYLGNYGLAQRIVDYKTEIDIDDFFSARYFNKMIFKFFSFAKEKRNQILNSTPSFSFPLAYREEFESSNKSSTVTTPLLLSIARQESAFNPYARSAADAFGLLQIIPEQAKRLAKKYKIPYKDFNSLYRPETNIALSSLLLNELMKRQNNNFINFVASYNAGENALKRWRKRIHKLTDLEFIEHIPYRETRKYVKLVARNYLVYRRMLSKSNFKIEEDFFRKGHMFKESIGK